MTAVHPFAPSRLDGRSDRRVLVEMARDVAPGTLLTFKQLEAALSVGVSAAITRARVCAAARQASRTLLREHRRCLQAVPRMGYKILESAEHVGAALERKRRGSNQIRHGVEVLRNTRLDELTDTQRRLHEGWTLVLSGVAAAISHTEKRVQRQDAAIASLVKRVDSLESKG